MKRQYLDKFVYILIILLIIFGVFLQITTAKNTDKLKNEEIKKAEGYASKIAQLVVDRTGENIESTLTNNPTLRSHLNDCLHAFLAKQYQYIFILEKDNNGRYRFLLDGSKNDSEDYKSLFFPKSELFDTVYSTQKMQIIEQNEGVEQIWLSLVYPIVIKNKTEALLVLDLSESYANYLNDFNSPLLNIVWLMQAFLILSLALLLFFAYRFYRLRQEIIKDTLTSLHTKRYLLEFFEKHSINNYNAILIDIDKLNEVNKLFGYKAGNEVIREFAQTLLSTLPRTAIAARTGGGEFFIVFPKSEETIKIQIQKTFNTLSEKKYLVKNEVLGLTLSMSGMSVPDDTTSIHDVERVLDEKLLNVKNKGKNGFAVVSDIELNGVHYNNIDYIKNALEEERLKCLYQPIFCIKTNKIIKYEALVRLIDSEDSNKLIEPIHFMKLIRGTSQYIKMSKFVLREVFNTLKKYNDIEVSVNIDLADLNNVDTMALITKHLHKHRDIANRITFEILEDNEVQDYEKFTYFLQQLKSFGAKVALDDFGSGYASYSYLIKLDIDILKIDGSLISELKSSPENAKAVISSIKELSDQFGHMLVAEYISDEETYNEIKDIGVEYAQGFYLGEPKPIDYYLQDDM